MMMYIQTLTDIVCLCTPCDRVKHIGLSKLLADQGKINFQEVIDHYCRINQCTEIEFKHDRYIALQIHAIRSHHQWQQVIGDYNAFLIG